MTPFVKSNVSGVTRYKTSLFIPTSVREVNVLVFETKASKILCDQLLCIFDILTIHHRELLSGHVSLRMEMFPLFECLFFSLGQ